MKLRTMIVALAAVISTGAMAESYKIDSSHTYPSFEADHQQLSYWRGKFTKTSGTVEYDKAAKTGSVDITIDATSIDFGHEKMNEHAKSKDIFDVATYPTATYKGAMKFTGDVPTSVDGELTLHGVTKPVKLTIGRFVCRDKPQVKCGADATATFNRADFGVSFGLPNFLPDVKLQIQVEAGLANAAPPGAAPGGAPKAGPLPGAAAAPVAAAAAKAVEAVKAAVPAK